ncbi:TonB-dependent receptor [Sphingopyxis sp.]|uniref:TonB-dependent receptor n=1 Tax=Sphingopyxis sp. TaxID=1908224 RepID=UPI002606056C|nr:TonB-dependent receptor [Sphingopyxis sp.]MCW0199710.1 TonB-dependent receptor [Sphingopyxis sp.]
MAIQMARGIRTLGRLACGASLAALAVAPAWGQEAVPADTAADGGQDEIVVTGFRQSLQAALNVKRDSVAAVDAIVAEDIAKFPDQNLAESLQRIPGISIQRDGGEGRAITVRGLGAQFTRVRLNGLETVATSTDGASSNRDRAFDFNVFASELFSSIVVHKTAEASLDEGSLGAVVDLNTGNPLGGKAGLHGALSLVGSYNDLSKDLGPRVAGLLSWRNDAGTFGASVSAAYSKQNTLELGNNSVRWAQAKFRSVDGVSCAAANATCDPVSLAFHPRIPRYGEIAHRRERLGLTGSVQFAPTDATKISIDALYSRFREDREEKWGEVLLRSNEKNFDVLNPVIDSNNNLISATFNNAYVRTEHYLRQSQTEFYQIGGSWDQDIGDSFRFTLLGGFSKSDANIPVETTVAFDDRDAQGYSYDYSDMKSPLLTFGTDVTDPSNFQLAEIRDRPSNVTNKFKTAQLRTEWDVADGFQIKAGGMWRRFNFDTVAFTRDTVVCGSSGPDNVLGTITCSSSVYGFPVTSELSDLFTLGRSGQPAGNSNQWVIANFPAATDYTHLYDRTANPDIGNTRSVQETTSGGYLQFDAKGELLGLRYAGNAGIRYVRTAQVSSSGSGVTVRRHYDDWLPSFNIALFPTDDVIVRGAIGKVITRPSFGNLNPSGSIDGFNYKATYGNPYLDPYRATNFDAGIEWYFAPQAVLSIAGFIKSIDSFPVSGTYSATLAQLGLDKSALLPSSPAYINFDPNQQYVVSAQVNGKGAKLKGVELAAQVPFSAFVDQGFISHFGILANATFISSKADYTVQGPAVVPGGPLISETRSTTLFGVSKRAYNGTLYYDDGAFSARVSASYRSRYVDANSGTGNIFEGYGATWNMDASVRYKLTEWVELSVEGNNLLDTYRYRFTDFDADRSYENNHFGRTILFGARFKM